MDSVVAVNPGAIGGLALISDLQDQIMLRDLKSLLKIDIFRVEDVAFIALNKHRASTVVY